MLVAFAAASLSFAQQTETGLKGIGKIIVDGTPSYTTTSIHVNDNVATDTATNASVIGRGNTLVFTPNSNFIAQLNAYDLKSGGSKVASYTGMTAHVGCFSVTPVDSNLMTLYEVNWSSGDSVFVYARSYDVYITRQEKPGEVNVDDKHRWLVKSGYTARISDVQLCKPLVGIWPQPNLPTALELGAATAAAVVPPIVWGTGSGAGQKQVLSAEGP